MIMKKIFLALGILTLVSVNAQQVVDAVNEPVFKEGEELNYEVQYGFVTVGEANLKVETSDVKFDGNNIFHLEATGKTRGMFDIFYKVSNRYDSYIDRNTFLPYLYAEDIREGSYKRKEEVRFYQSERKVISDKITYKASEQTFDLVSAYYFARSLNMKEITTNEKFILHYFLGDAILPMEIQYLGKEVVTTPFGKFNCLKFSPTIRPGKILKKGSRPYLWISNDTNRIPIRAEVELVVGALRLELTSAKGLKYPIVILK